MKKRSEEKRVENKKTKIIIEAKRCLKTSPKGSILIPYSKKEYEFIKDNLQELNNIAENQDPAFKIIKFEEETRNVKYKYVPAKQ